METRANIYDVFPIDALPPRRHQWEANQEIEMAVTLSFREEGPSYDRAKAVADAMGVSLQDYLLACIAEGAKVEWVNKNAGRARPKS